MCFTLGASIAEVVSAFPTCGGLYVLIVVIEHFCHSYSSFRYTASAQLVPKKHRARVSCRGSSSRVSMFMLFSGWVGSGMA